MTSIQSRLMVVEGWLTGTGDIFVHSNQTLRPLSQPPGRCPHHPSLLMYTVRKMMLQDNQLCNMMVRDTLSHTPLLTGPCRASVHHSRRSLEL